MSRPAPESSPNSTSSTPTSDGAGWYVDGVNRGRRDYAIRAVLRCLPEAGLAGAVWQSKTVFLDNAEGEAKTARCPDDYRAISGGSYFSTAGGIPDFDGAASKIMNSTPTADAEGWFGSAQSFGSLNFTVGVRCLPDEQLANYRRETTKTAVRASDTASKEGECPSSHPAVGPAGSFLERPGTGPVGNLGEGDSLSPGGALESVRSFFASAIVLSSEIDSVSLVGRAFCLRK